MNLEIVMVRGPSGRWYPEVHCGQCRRLVGSDGRILWDRGAELVAVPTIVCSNACEIARRDASPEVVFGGMALPEYWFFLAVSSGTAETIGTLLQQAALGDFLNNAGAAETARMKGSGGDSEWSSLQT